VSRYTAEGHEARFAAIAHEAVAQKSDVILGITTRVVVRLKKATSTIPIVGDTDDPVAPSALAAEAATTTIPVVFVVGPDPVQLCLVDNLNRPNGNLTGITNVHGGLVAKRLELLRELVPSASVIGYLFNAKNPNSGYLSEVQTAAHVLGQQSRGFPWRSVSLLDYTWGAQKTPHLPTRPLALRRGGFNWDSFRPTISPRQVGQRPSDKKAAKRVLAMHDRGAAGNLARPPL
jgi:hypothetical protein